MLSLQYLTPKQLMFMQMLIDGPIQCSHIDDYTGEQLDRMGLVKYNWRGGFLMWRLTLIGRLKLWINNRGQKPNIGKGRDTCPTCGPRCTRGFNS